MSSAPPSPRPSWWGASLRETAENLCDGSMAALLTHLVGGVDLSEPEIAALERLVEKLDPVDTAADGEPS